MQRHTLLPRRDAAQPSCPPPTCLPPAATHTAHMQARTRSRSWPQLLLRACAARPPIPAPPSPSPASPMAAAAAAVAAPAPAQENADRVPEGGGDGPLSARCAARAEPDRSPLAASAAAALPLLGLSTKGGVPDMRCANAAALLGPGARLCAKADVGFESIDMRESNAGGPVKLSLRPLPAACGEMGSSPTCDIRVCSCEALDGLLQLPLWAAVTVGALSGLM